MPEYVLITSADVIATVHAGSADEALRKWRLWHKRRAHHRLGNRVEAVVAGSRPAVFQDGRRIEVGG